MIKKNELEQARQRVEKLKELINHYRYNYHVLDESLMSEGAADSLKRELSELEEQFPELLTTDSPTQRVAGQALDKFTKVKHQKRMISLMDVFSLEELKLWRERNYKLLTSRYEERYFVDIKMDGLACAVRYKNGILVQAVTRGDGLVGEDVTENVRTIQNLPLKLNMIEVKSVEWQDVEVRGEVVIFNEDFEKINALQKKKGEKTFANPRNLAAGSIRQLDPVVAEGRPLRFVAYDVIKPELNSFEQTYVKLKELGFEISDQQVVFDDLDEVDRWLKEQEEKRKNLKFNTDGAVIKLNNRKLFEELGVVGKTPRGAVAFKFPAEESTTVIKDIVINIGRTGAATPIAILEPVVVAGSTVRHASLHNANEIARLDVRIGDTVIIYKAGDIIPQIKQVLTELRPIEAVKFDFEQALSAQFPDLEFEKIAGEVVYRLKNREKNMKRRAIEYFASKSALDIAGLGPQNVSVLMEAGLVENFSDLYKLKVEEVAKLERFGELSAKKLIEAIEIKKRPSLYKFLTALGIRYVGAETAMNLAKAFGSIQKIMGAEEEDFLKVPDVGMKVANSLVAYFADEENVEELERMFELGVSPVFEDVSGGRLTGKSYVISGTLVESGWSREEAEDKLRDLGADILKSVNKKTTALIVGERPGGTKLEKAQKLGVRVMSEIEFLKLING